MSKTYNSNIEQKIRAKYLYTYRILCALLILLVPIFWIVTQLTAPNTKSPVFFRESLILISALILFGSYKIVWFKKNMQKSMLILYALVSLWQLIMLNMNDFETNKCIGFLLISFAISVGFESKKYYLIFISFFLTSVFVLLFLNEKAIVNKSLFILTLISIQLISYFLNASKVNMEKAIIHTTNILKIKNEETLDSIKYAKRIQNAILPSHQSVNTLFPNSFIYYQPKAIVSGDFYWIHEKDNTKFFAVADCTGHGVPGAMVSVICHSALNRSVREFNLTEPSKILDKTRDLIIEEFSKSEEYVSDGMDIILCSIKDHELIYSGAHNPLWICRADELIEYKADKQPVGNFSHAKSFTSNFITLQPNDTIYMSTDGFADQFGGDNGKKMKRKNFKNYLKSITEKPLELQRQILNVKFEDWKGDFEQVDDVCVMGIKV